METNEQQGGIVVAGHVIDDKKFYYVKSNIIDFIQSNGNEFSLPFEGSRNMRHTDIFLVEESDVFDTYADIKSIKGRTQTKELIFEFNPSVDEVKQHMDNVKDERANLFILSNFKVFVKNNKHTKERNMAINYRIKNVNIVE